METCTICRSVLPVKPGAGGRLAVSVSCGPVAQVPTQWLAPESAAGDGPLASASTARSAAPESIAPTAASLVTLASEPLPPPEPEAPVIASLTGLPPPAAPPPPAPPPPTPPEPAAPPTDDAPPVPTVPPAPAESAPPVASRPPPFAEFPHDVAAAPVIRQTTSHATGRIGRVMVVLLLKRRRGPIDPSGRIERDVLVVLQHGRARGPIADQELRHISLHLGHLRRGKCAMIVTADQRESHLVGNAKRLPDQMRRHRIVGGAHRPQPIDVVLDDQERTRRHQPFDHVMIEGKPRGGGVELVERRRKPYIFAGDLAQRLNVRPGVVLSVGNPPTGGPARAGLLRNGEGDAFVERAGNEGAFAVARAAGHPESLGIDAGGRCLFERI